MTSLREVQKTEHDMLEILNTVCEKLKIEYFLAQGTLLGAVRHKGFIPWDDDIDVIVPYEDIPRLIEYINKEYGEELFATNHTVEKYYPYSWTKIRKLNTTSMPVRYKKLPVNWGICIDIFPFYPMSNNAMVRKAEVFIFKCGRKLLLGSMTRYDEKRSFATRMVELIPLGIRRALADLMMNVFKHNVSQKAEYIFLTCKGGKCMKSDVIYANSGELKFEGLEYPVPGDYDGFLKEMFGDYMTPPPETERKGHVLRMGDIIWDCDKSYTQYK